MVGILLSVIRRIISLILIVAVLLITVFVVGIYGFGWENQATKVFLKIIPLPAALVDFKIISLAELGRQAEIYERLVEFQSDLDFKSPAGSRELAYQKSLILKSLIEQTMVNDLAKQRGLVTSSQELDRYYRFLLHQFGMDRTKVREELENFLGLSEEGFKKLIVLPDLTRSKLAMALLAEDRESEVYRRLNRVRAELRAGLDFAEAARLYSEDRASQFIGGEIGFLAREDLPPWLSDAAFDLEAGAISQIVISPEGYHLFQAAAKDEASHPPRLQLRQILIKAASFEDYLVKQRDNYRIYSFGKF